MTILPDNPNDFELKARHRAMWALGDYPAVAADVIPDLGSVLVEACGVRSGDTVLDIACGSGNAAIPAALLGARVTACDLTPALLEAGRDLAAKRGAEVTWREADAEALPFDDGAFDVVLSCLGIMFAPHHQASVEELLRVCRPGGAIGLVSWTPEGFVGQMFSAMKPYSAAPPPGSQPPAAQSVSSCRNEARQVCKLGARRVAPTVTTPRTVQSASSRTATAARTGMVSPASAPPAFAGGEMPNPIMG